MKKTAQKTGGKNHGLAHLGGLTATQFMRTHWQKKPLLIRNAFPDFAGPLTKHEVLELAQREDAESRLIARSGKEWTLQHGPFTRRSFSAVKRAEWTVLIQDTQHFSGEAHDLLAYFNFIPHARVEDLMVSYAIPGAGVGPHVDTYDVFLLQGLGRRRWQISSQQDLRLKQGVPLKMLAHFRAEQELVLETGDMLYLPPGYAHNGIADSECLTWSVGFRAPSQQEVSIALLDYLRDEIAFGGQYRDPDLLPVAYPGEINAAMRRRFAGMFKEVVRATGSRAHQTRCLGRYLTDPKPHVFFDAPDAVLSMAAFRRAACRRGIMLDLKTRFLYADGLFFMNGGDVPIEVVDSRFLRPLADARTLTPHAVALVSRPSSFAALYGAYTNGYLHVG
ncbi:MAG: cupin domain-containing protein [Betaproteobacteria bacterium]